LKYLMAIALLDDVNRGRAPGADLQQDNWHSGVRPCGVLLAGLFRRAPRAVGAGRDFTGDLTAQAFRVVGAHELAAAALPLQAGEDFRAQKGYDTLRVSTVIL
jgi:hypothetical protein